MIHRFSQLTCTEHLLHARFQFTVPTTEITRQNVPLPSCGLGVKRGDNVPYADTAVFQGPDAVKVCPQEEAGRSCSLGGREGSSAAVA